MAQGYAGEGRTTNFTTEFLKQQKDADFTAAAGFEYFVDNSVAATQTIATLPQTPSDGDVIRFIAGSNTGGLRIKENATGQHAIRFNGDVSAGTGSGYWERTAAYGFIEVVYSTDDSEWHVTGSLAVWASDAADSQSAGLVGSESPVAGAASLYDAGGRIQTNDPVDALDVVNKQTFDAASYPTILAGGLESFTTAAGDMHPTRWAGSFFSQGDHNAKLPFRRAVTLQNFVVIPQNEGLSGGESYELEVYKNGASTGYKVTINNGVSLGSQILATGTPPSFAEGDYMTLRGTYSGALRSMQFNWSLEAL